MYSSNFSTEFDWKWLQNFRTKKPILSQDYLVTLWALYPGLSLKIQVWMSSFAACLLIWILNIIINSWIFLEFYETFNSLKTKLDIETPKKYNTTNDFLRKLKMVMAKLAVSLIYWIENFFMEKKYYAFIRFVSVGSRLDII